MAEYPVMQAGNAGPSPETALDYLPRPDIQVFEKAGQIYGPRDLVANLYLVMEGRVSVSRLNGSGVSVVVDIYQAGDFFGESALLHAPREAEQAVALEPCKVMVWMAAQIVALMDTEPRLTLALMQLVARRCVELAKRLESLSVEGTARRLARVLIQFADRENASPADGEITIAPLTHEMLALYVGTSREIVTHQMGAFRRQGYLRYSRQGISIQRNRLESWLSGKAK